MLKMLTMLAGSHHIRLALIQLQCRDLAPKRRVTAAALQVWSAFYFRDGWPQPLQAQAESLQRRLLAAGPIVETVRRMDEDALAEAAQALADFIQLFRSADADSVPSDGG